MNCPFCREHLEKFNDEICIKDKITYWRAEQLKHLSRTPLAVEFSSRHPNQDAFFFWDHDKYYTISEMERIAKLKAFL
jgi:hypothetical protein